MRELVSMTSGGSARGATTTARRSTPCGLRRLRRFPRPSQRFKPVGRVLELACGTGIWSEQLLLSASHLTALDGPPEMLTINAAARLQQSARVRYIHADIFAWRREEQFDVVFFGFWLSHVPPERFTAFWQLVGSCLAPDGRVFFVDSCHEQTSTAVDHRLPEAEATVLRRRLNDGPEFQIYKVFYDPRELTERLHKLGWHFDIRQTEHYFLYGTGHQLASGSPNSAPKSVVRRALRAVTHRRH